MKNSEYEVELSPLMKSLINNLADGNVKLKSSKNGGIKVVYDKHPDLQKEEGTPSLSKSLLNQLNGSEHSIERLAFEADPALTNQFSSLYKAKQRLIPDHILKRIGIQDDLVASILGVRQNHVASFGRPREDRFDIGLVLEPKKGVLDRVDNEQKEELQKRIDQTIERLITCGETKGWNDQERMSLTQFLYLSTRNALLVGRTATEIVHVVGIDGERKFHSFRPIDAGTIYKAVPQKEAGDSVRREARVLLEQIKNKRLEPEKFQADEYTWVQVIDGRPVQAFTSDECIVQNFYPVTDVELDGYPVTPLDTAIAAVTTHINITTHNKLYFQSGRATRGMLIIKSDDVDAQVVSHVRQQFNAAINSVNNSWRMPVFGIGTEDDMVWSPIDSGARDMEFQYLSDMNARVILSAFQMSPEELPGWSYLSRGTNSQALSEGSNEYRLEAARDVGIRPLLKHFEDFLNTHILPLLDPMVAKLAVIKLMGLDADTAEKESIRYQQDQLLHMTYDELLTGVDKEPVGRAMGGDFPLNPNYQTILDKFYTVGQIKEFWFGEKDASKDPKWAYVRDEFWMQWQQQQQAQQQAQAQAQQQAQQPQNPSQGPQDAPQSTQTQDQGEDLTRSLDQAIGLLSKSEAQLPPSKRRLLHQQKATIQHFLDGWEDDLKQATKEILEVAEMHVPPTKKK